jgi:hypothetical protein
MFSAAVLVAAPGALAGELKVENGDVMHGKDKWTGDVIGKLPKKSTLHQTKKSASKGENKKWTHEAKTLAMEPKQVKVDGKAKVATYGAVTAAIEKVKTGAKLTLTSSAEDGAVFTVQQKSEDQTWESPMNSKSEAADPKVFGGDLDAAALFAAGAKEASDKINGVAYKVEITPAEMETTTPATRVITFSEPLITLELAKEGEGAEEQWKGTSGKVAFAHKVVGLPTSGSIVEVTKDGQVVKMQLTADPVIDGEKCTMTLQDATVANTTATFTLKDGKWVDSADAKDQKKVVVSEDEPLVWTSENEDFKSDADMLALIKATVDTYTWTFEAAKKSGYMMWIIIGCSVLLIAVICFFVFGGKKNTDSDDESDLDTSDDEEEDAAATETKEEEA